MGRAVQLLLCGVLLLQGGLSSAVAQETSAGWSTLTSLGDTAGPEDPVGTHLPSIYPSLSSALKSASGLQPSTSGPAEAGPTDEAAVVTEEPVSREDNSSNHNTTVAPSSGDIDTEDHQNHTAAAGPAPTGESDPSGLNSTAEGEVVQPTQTPSPTTQGDEPSATATVGVHHTEEPASTALVPTTPRTNHTRETTQSPVAPGEDTEHTTVFNSTTGTAEVATTVVAPTLATSTKHEATKHEDSTVVFTSATRLAPADGKQAPSIFNVGDDEKGVNNRALSSTDPLVVAVISVFIIMVGVLALVGFLRYRQRSSRTEFRRLQDLPMDDMMEDTPLSLYSY